MLVFYFGLLLSGLNQLAAAVRPLLPLLNERTAKSDEQGAVGTEADADAQAEAEGGANKTLVREMDTEEGQTDGEVIEIR